MFSNILSWWKSKLIINVDNPLEASKRMINNIESVVGIRDTFGDEKNKKNFTIISILSTIVFCGGFIYTGPFSQGVYFFQVLPDKINSFQAMNCFSSTCVPLSKFILMYCSRTRLSIIMDMSREGLQAIPKGSSAHSTMMKTIQKAGYVSWLVILNQMFVHVSYLLLPFLMTIFGNNRYLPTTPGGIYGIPSKYESPYYEINFIVTTIATTFSGINQTGYIVLFVTLVGNELGHFYAICETLNDIHKILYNNTQHNEEERNNCADSKQTTALSDSAFAEDKHKKIDNMLRFCVKHQQFLFRYHEKICELYKVIFGAHFLIMIIVLVTTLQTMNSWGLMNTILTGVTGTMPLIVYCFGGELLLTAGSDMSYGIYSCGWEAMEIKHSRMVQLMLCMSQHPLCYTAAGIFIMNHDTFGNVVQVIYKIYAVFN
ncbi:unnamed protein product [Diatraea saccharalis]|uniref:Odorant receptor n=1 Tax=Diatraea saccharalis TaxID=40085 RepID=A0A9N9RFN0_9NEOP|nr:unnamed protein product [Diatraea saccharalis]